MQHSYYNATQITEMVFRGANKGIAKLKGKEMKFKIGKTEIMIVNLLQDVVRCLYRPLPEASLLHADIETTESQYDSENTNLYVRGTFSVSVTPIIKVEFQIDTTFTRSKHFRKGKWGRPDEISIKHEESGEGVRILEINNRMSIRGKDSIEFKDVKAFYAMIGNPPKNDND